MERKSLEVLLGQGLTISEIAKRFGKAPSTVANWIDKHGLEPVHRGTHARPINIDCDRLESLVRSGMTVRQISNELGLNTVTVRRHLARLGLRTAHTRTVEAQRAAKDAGLLRVILACPHHGDAEFVIEGRGYYRCTRCRAAEWLVAAGRSKPFWSRQRAESVLCAATTAMPGRLSSTTLILARSDSGWRLAA